MTQQESMTEASEDDYSRMSKDQMDLQTIIRLLMKVEGFHELLWQIYNREWQFPLRATQG